MISKIQTLKDLNLEQNEGVNREVIDNLIKLPGLVHLKIGINDQVTGDALRAIGDLKKIEELNLDMVNLDDEMAEYLAPKLKNVSELYVGHTFITLKGLRAFLKMPALKFINISGCKHLQDEDSMESIEILSKTIKRVEISNRSRMLKN